MINKITIAFIIFMSLFALTMCMAKERPKETYDGYAAKCKAAGGVVIILPKERICVTEASMLKVML